MARLFDALFTCLFSLLILSCFRSSNSFDADATNLEEEIQQLRGNYERMEVKVSELTKKVTQLETQLLKSKVHGTETDMRRSCGEIKSAYPGMDSGMYWIDPDGQDVGDDPIEVHCDMTSGITSILHDSEEYVEVDNCVDAGCYSRDIQYSASDRQITKLIELSNECHQYFKYDCIEAPFEFNGQQVSWWDDRHGNPQYFWSGKHTSSHTCDCGINGNCVGGSTKKCHCDSRLSYSESDQGIITDKSVLPIKRLHFGHTSTGSGGHTLGRFQCSGQMANQIVNKIPTSCADLRALGHASSGFYFIQGAQKIETVYCEFTKLLTEEASDRQITKLIELSNECHQYFKYDCIEAPFEFDSQQVSWWDDRHGDQQHFWSGKYTSSHTCHCGINGNCLDSAEKCNCDSRLSSPQSDEGIITDKSILPIKRLHFGHTSTGSGGHTLGRFQCSGETANEIVNEMASSCADLRALGHSSSGFYLVQGAEIVETVYCDFSKLQSEEGFETWVGYADLKPEPTHSGMPKSCADLRGIGHTSFSSGFYPIMGEKLVEMVYCEFPISPQKEVFEEWMGYADLKPEPTFAGLPRSCEDLLGIGHTTFSNGFYSILGETFVEMVYCNFDTSPNSTIDFHIDLGVIDVKSNATFFYGQRTAPYVPKPGPTQNIPFDAPPNSPLNFNVLNIGSGWDALFDHFQAPVKGRYFFSVSGIATCRTATLTCKCTASLRKKTTAGVDPSTVGSAMGEVDMERRDKTSTDSETFSIQATLDLNKGDKIWLEVDLLTSSPVANLYDDLRHFTHFTAILLQEDIIDSLELYL